MATANLLQLFQALVLPIPAASGNELSAAPIPGIETHRLAKDASGSPCLLIRQSPQNASSTPIRMENLHISFDAPCTVVHPGRKPEQDTFTIIRCTAANPALFPHFLTILSPMVAALGPAPTRSGSPSGNLRSRRTFPGAHTVPDQRPFKVSGPNYC